MAKSFIYSAFLVLVLIWVQINDSEQLQSSHGHTLLRIKSLLNHPTVLNSWNSTTEFCNTESSSSSTVVCYEDTITHLHIVGNKGAPMLPKNFSIDSFITTLAENASTTGAAVAMNPRWPKGQVMDETCWSNKEYCRTTKEHSR